MPGLKRISQRKGEKDRCCKIYPENYKEEEEKPVFEEDEYLDSVEPLGKKELEEAEAAAEAEIAAKESEAVKAALESGSAILSKRLKKKALKAKAKNAGMEDDEDVDMDGEAPKDLQSMIDKYYALDFEDIVGGVKCRFKYTQVEPDRSGLTVEDILNADDEEIKRVVPMRELAAYIPPEEQVTAQKIDWEEELTNARKDIQREKDAKKAARKAQKERAKKFKAAKRAAEQSAPAQKKEAAPPAKKPKKAMRKKPAQKK